MTPSRTVEAFARRHRYHPLEALPWLAAVASYFLFPDYYWMIVPILAVWQCAEFSWPGFYQRYRRIPWYCSPERLECAFSPLDAAFIE